MSFDAPVALRAAASQSTPTSWMPRRGLLVAFLAALLAVGSLATAPAPVSAAGIKVAVVVGPAGSLTSSYIRSARGYAAQARSYGATVVEVYTPNATWARVRSAVQGANLLIFLGHGNGFPSPYLSTLNPLKMDGFGLNGYLGSGNVRTTYFGEYYVRTQVKLAPNAVVILNHLCYSAGSSEPGRANPTLSVARRRVDNFAAGFLRTGAKAVFAETLGSASYIIHGEPDDAPDLLERPQPDVVLPILVRLGADARDDRGHGPARARLLLPERRRDALDDGEHLAAVVPNRAEQPGRSPHGL